MTGDFSFLIPLIIAVIVIAFISVGTYVASRYKTCPSDRIMVV